MMEEDAKLQEKIHKKQKEMEVCMEWMSKLQ
jgi:hypothetical protein